MIRELLLAIEEKTDPSGVRMSDFEHPLYPDSSARRKHFILLAEAGFIVYEASKSSTNPNRIINLVVFDVSWEGHEFLDSIRDSKIWNATKQASKKIGSSSFSILMDIAKSMALQMLKQGGVPIH